MFILNFQGIGIKDNDSLSALLAAEVQSDLLIMMSDVDGIYNKPPWEDGARMMHTYTSKDKDLVQFGQKSKVRFFRVMIKNFMQGILVIEYVLVNSEPERLRSYSL